MNMRTGAFGVDSQATVDDGGPSKTVIGAGAVQRTLLACGLRAFSPFCALDASAPIEHPKPAGTYEPTSLTPWPIQLGASLCRRRIPPISVSPDFKTRPSIV